jgi:hypothetical protein
MKWKIAPLLAVAAFGAAAAAVAVHGAGTREVAGQRFAVPDEWLFNDRIAWLPAPEPDAFTFHLDPIRDPNEIPPHLVSVEPADRICRDDGQSQIVRIACGRERTTVAVAPPFEKVFPHPDYTSAWDYYAAASSAAGEVARRQVAWCTPISPNPARPKGTAICTSVWGFDGLVLSLGFEEGELAQLPAMQARATKMLRSWRVR